MNVYQDGVWFVVDEEQYYVNGFGWMFKRTRDAFYVSYQVSENESQEVVYEPSDEAHIVLIPAVEDIDACVEFGYSLISGA
ncbi:hypothetical protein [Alicyclobacillus sp. ALC3]|uniref:hypothetical protein n=1 Tax=Alicyclobacillus sp. ALC3 TaxID=2796143 RepID=UPI0023789865|nr:hypothetical protein [Alicyclobacillus sp. ALC3]WDL99792.1 hypothetical protein JC200_23770 [Alicyclobacillus sp. ALC3]